MEEEKKELEAVEEQPEQPKEEPVAEEPVNEKIEFPVAGALIIGGIFLFMIACFVVLMIL